MKKVISIRPKVIFKQCEQQLSLAERRFVSNIPSSEIGGLTLLEGAILISLAKLIDAKSIFEFGTFMGATTSLFALNTDKSCQVTTLDLPRDTAEKHSIDGSLVLTNGEENDKYLTQKFVRSGPIYLEGIDSLCPGKVTQLYANSRTMDIVDMKLADKFQLIFIDGGHDYETVMKDTENALRMKLDDSIIVWHDYRSSIHGDVTTFLDEFCQKENIYHVENTMLAISLFGKFKSLISTD